MAASGTFPRQVTSVIKLPHLYARMRAKVQRVLYTSAGIAVKE